MPDINNISKSKTTYLGVIGIIIAAWTSVCYTEGVLVNLDWPLVAVIAMMVIGRSVQMLCEKGK